MNEEIMSTHQQTNKRTLNCANSLQKTKDELKHNLIDVSPLEDVREDQRSVACVRDPETPGSHDEIQKQQAPQQHEGGEEVFSRAL